MKEKLLSHLVVFTVLVCCPAFFAVGQATNSATNSATNTTMGVSATSTAANGLLSDKDLSELKTDWTDEKTGIRYVLDAGFGAPKLEDKDKKRYQKMGRVPFRITCALYEIKKTKGSALTQRMTGTAKFYVLDESKKDIIKKSVSLEKMCPS